MAKKISVIVVTARMGCFDVLVNGFCQQTMPLSDYEVIIMDSCYEERRWYMPQWSLPSNFYHLEVPNTYDYYDACFANNYGLRRATGELVVFFSDLNWPEPKFLERHWQVYKDCPGYSMTGYCDRYPVPELRDELEWRAAYWSIFKEPFTLRRARWYFANTPIEYAERKGNITGAAVPGSPYFELPGDFFYGSLNESIPMSVLQELNGWDQIYDGGYGRSDIDLGFRANQIGWKFLIVPESINNKFGTQATVGKVPGKGKQRIRGDNWEIYQRERANILAGARSPKAIIGAWG
jgi:hypothetical protein